MSSSASSASSSDEETFAGSSQVASVQPYPGNGKSHRSLPFRHLLQSNVGDDDASQSPASGLKQKNIEKEGNTATRAREDDDILDTTYKHTVPDHRYATRWDSVDNSEDDAVMRDAMEQSSKAFGKLPKFINPNFITHHPAPLNTAYEIETSQVLEMYKIHCVTTELALGDTLVYINLHRTTSSTNTVDCFGRAFESKTFRVHSEKLLATGSSKFSKMLSPTYQFRIQRRLKLVNKLPEGIKYVLDLTPPTEGDERVFQLTELSLTPGIMTWWTSEMLHGVDASLVLGHDDACTCQRYPHFGHGDRATQVNITNRNRSHEGTPGQTSKSDESKVEGASEQVAIPPSPDQLLRLGKMDDPPSVYETPSFRKINDYCPFRHFAGIIRLLTLIEGRDIILDSATRVWTLVALAKIFDCTLVVQSRVAQWLLHGANARFIEVLPEEALRIGHTLQLSEVTQCSFRILVNELALELEASAEQKHNLATIFGRKRGDCGDELNNLIQYAAQALLERISSTVAMLEGPNALDLLDIVQWRRLRTFERILQKEKGKLAAEALLELQHFMKNVSFAFSVQFYMAVQDEAIKNSVSYSGMDKDRATYANAKDFRLLKDILDSFSLKQKFLCPFIYNAIEQQFDMDTFVTGFLTAVLTETALRKGLDDVPALEHASLWSLLHSVQIRLTNFLWSAPIDELSEDWWSEFPFDMGAKLNGVNTIDLDKFCDPDAPWFDLRKFGGQVSQALRPITNSWIRHDIEPPSNITRHLLLNLTNNEMKFLPLWAGGCDDGSGGVFESYVPPTDMGPCGPGPAYSTGHTVPSAPSSTFSLMEGVSGLNVRGSTVASSLAAQDSISTVYQPDYVIADDVSIATESFATEDSNYQNARFASPAEHQGIGLAVDALVETVDDDEFQSAYADDDSDKTMSEIDDHWSDFDDTDNEIAISSAEQGAES